MKNKDLCDYDPRCIMSSGLMFDVIIMGKISKNELPHHTTLVTSQDVLFTLILWYVAKSIFRS